MALWKAEVHEIYYVWVEADTGEEAAELGVNPENWAEVEEDETHDIEIVGEPQREDEVE